MKSKEINSSTICAIATPAGTGAISIVRLSGKESYNIAKKNWISSSKNLKTLEPRYFYLGWIVDGKNKIDQAMIVYMPAPNSYTGEDIVELHLHGSQAITQKVLDLLVRGGAKLAEPGEFTKRAFLSGKLDLTQAEAVGDLIAAKNNKAMQLSTQQLAGKLTIQIDDIKRDILSQSAYLVAALDFSEEDIASQNNKELLTNNTKIIDKVCEILKNSKNSAVIREGFKVALVGLPNAGKSTLLNSLLGYSRSITTSIAGTTRDTLTETINVDGVDINLTDTAGIRNAEDKVEKIGVKRTIQEIKKSDYIILLIEPNKRADTLKYLKNSNLLKYINSNNCLVVYTKVDINKDKESTKILNSVKSIEISAKTGLNITKLKKHLASIAVKNNQEETINLLTKRQIILLEKLNEQLILVKTQLENKVPNDIVLIEYQNALSICNQLTGQDVTEEIINQVFSTFCIGK